MPTPIQLLEQKHYLALFQILEATLEADAHRQQLRMLKQDYNGLQAFHLAQRLEWEQYETMLADLHQPLASLVRQLDASAELPRTNIVELPILVFAHAHEHRVKEMADLFRKFAFVGTEVRTWEDNPVLGSYPIVVFDNQHLLKEDAQLDKHPLRMQQAEARAIRIQAMEYCIQNSTAILLHYGNYLKWLEDHRRRVHAANSQFALFARLREMVEFLEVTRA